jgi:tetratricopeptide (TPR) repeat protein
MRFSVIHTPSSVDLQIARLLALGLLCLGVLLWLARPAFAQDPVTPGSARERLHETEQWRQIQAHLPSPVTASSHELEQQGDILRARRFPDDAMDYYKYAIARGGDTASLMNKLGLTELEMKNIQLAGAYFQRVVKMNRKNGEAWNNLGAVAFLEGESGNAVRSYKRAIKLEKHEAVFHANLATAYFQTKDFNGARRELAEAMKCDPHVFERREGFGGVAAHVLSAQDRARFSFEMAKLYARNGLEDQMIHSLAMASEAGMDVQREMLRDEVLAKYEGDPRVLVLVHNAEALRANRGGGPARPFSNADGDAGTAAPKPL